MEELLADAEARGDTAAAQLMAVSSREAELAQVWCGASHCHSDTQWGGGCASQGGACAGCATHANFYARCWCVCVCLCVCKPAVEAQAPACGARTVVRHREGPLPYAYDPSQPSLRRVHVYALCLQEIRSLQSQLDRTHFEKTRAQRSLDPITAKYEAMKKDLRAAAVPVAGQLSGDAYVHATRAQQGHLAH